MICFHYHQKSEYSIKNKVKMKRILTSLKLQAFTLITVVLLSGNLSAQQIMLTSSTTTLNVEDEYSEEINKLIKHFDSKDINIRPFLKDERFELYNGISKRFTGSAEKKSVSLDSYKKVLGFDSKKEQIRTFMDTYNKELNAAEKEYGIPKSVISAILGVESSFGKVSGKYNPFNVYTSMYSENYRASFALAQLEELLKFTSKRNLDVFELKSSYAGAMTHAQFIPYSLNHWFVGDDINSMESSITSVANYLAHFKNITGSVEKAVYRYNPSQLYTDAVMDLANEAEKFYTAK